MVKKRSISFSDTPEKIQEIKDYAKEKGFNNASTLLRFALYQYIHRYPLKTP